jgi:3-oxoacyl-[acyl-carrier-protein] synthase III
MPSTLERVAPSATVVAPQRSAGIIGLGVALPADVVSSATIGERLGVEEQWLVRRTGIRARHRLGAGERVSDLASAAAFEALADAELDASAIDLVLVATTTADELTPNVAPLVAAAIGADRAGAMDVGSACTGFVSALGVAAAIVESARADRVLVAGAEGLSRVTDPDDRPTAGLFGDGAGAVVLSAAGSGRIGPVLLGADGARCALIRAQHGGFIEMNGHETFRQAVRRLSEVTPHACAAAGVALEEIELFVFHQANERILRAVAERLGLPDERVVNAIATLGNTSAASIPLALHAARADARLTPGSRVLLGAFGAGLTWGATVVTWGER